MSSSVGMLIPNIWKNKKCSKPPTRQLIVVIVVKSPFLDSLRSWKVATWLDSARHVVVSPQIHGFISILSLISSVQQPLWSYPLVNVYMTMRNHPVFYWENSLEISMFNSYVELAEGKSSWTHPRVGSRRGTTKPPHPTIGAPNLSISARSWKQPQIDMDLMSVVRIIGDF